jgi:hypothetical protein
MTIFILVPNSFYAPPPLSQPSINPSGEQVCCTRQLFTTSFTALSCLKWRRRNASFRSQNRWKIVGYHIWWYGGWGKTQILRVHSDFVPWYNGLHDVGRCLAAKSGQKKNCFVMRFLLSWFRSRSLYLPLFTNKKLSQALSYWEFYNFFRCSVEGPFYSRR